MKLYLAGPMSGLVGYNHALFTDVEDFLVKAGHQVTTPFHTNSVVWQRHFGKDFDPYQDACDYGDPKLMEMWVENVKAITEAEGVALLPQWRGSKGTRVEIATANLLGKKFYEITRNTLKDHWEIGRIPLLVSVEVAAVAPAQVDVW